MSTGKALVLIATVCGAALAGAARARCSTMGLRGRRAGRRRNDSLRERWNTAAGQIVEPDGGAGFDFAWTADAFPAPTYRGYGSPDSYEQFAEDPGALLFDRRQPLVREGERPPLVRLQRRRRGRPGRDAARDDGAAHAGRQRSSAARDPLAARRILSAGRLRLTLDVEQERRCAARPGLAPAIALGWRRPAREATS